MNSKISENSVKTENSKISENSVKTENSKMSKNSVKARNWVFTIFNYDDEYKEYLNTGIDKSKIINLMYQEEICPSSLKKHLQGHVIFTNARHLAGVKKYLKCNSAHLEIMRGTPQQSAEYVTKSESAVIGTQVCVGELPVGQGHRSDLNECISKIRNKTISYYDIELEYPQLFVQYRNGLREICDKYWGTPRNYKTNVAVYYGQSGTGKSKIAFEENPNAYVLRPNKNAVWFDGYAYNETVIIDDFYGWIPFNMLLNLLDRYSMKVDIKGGAMEFNSKKIIITSNKSPLDWYPNLSNEHKYALLRRLDECLYFSRESTINVMNGLKMKLNELAVTESAVSVDELVSKTESIKNLAHGTEVPQGNTILEEPDFGTKILGQASVSENSVETESRYKSYNNCSTSYVLPINIKYNSTVSNSYGITYYNSNVAVWHYSNKYKTGAPIAHSCEEPYNLEYDSECDCYS